MKSPSTLLRAVLTDVKRLDPGAKGLDRDLLTIEERVKNEGISFLTVTLPKLDRAVLDGLRSGRFASPTGFSKVRGTVIPRLFSGLTSGIFDPTSGLLLEDPDISKLKSLRELCNLFKKLLLDPKRNDELSRKEIEKFFSNDEICARHHVDHYVSDRLRRVSNFILPRLNTWEVFERSGKHGPGAVFEGTKGNQKWSLLFDTISSMDVDLDTTGLGEFFYARYGIVDPNQLELFPRSEIIPQRDGSSGRSARLVTVPKNSTSVRTITVEPLWKQYVQQGLNRDLRKAISSCPVLSNCIALSDQSLSQKLALEGSISQTWSTLDLKSASDLLSLELVRIIFGTKVRFLEELLKARSESIVTDKETFLSKFAGMGNATTFPVQSVCFAVIGIAAILEYQGKPWKTSNVVAASRCIRVYGDDIAVHSEYAHQVVAWLESAGLKVNADKSYLEGNFRESCGVDAYAGVDITPVYARLLPGTSGDKASTLAHCVALSNSMFLRGLYTASEHVKEWVESVYKIRLPLVSKTSGGLGWHTRQDAFTPTYWCKDTQQLKTKTVALVAKRYRDWLDGYPALLKFFHLSDERLDHDQPISVDSDHLQKSNMRFRNLIRPRRVHC